MTMRARPLSPHLQVYRPQLTSVLSIAHRATGVILSAGILALIVWLAALASGPEDFHTAQECAGSVVGIIFLTGWIFCFFYHLLNGVRHLLWDMGRGLSLPAVYRSGWAVVILSVLLTILTWVAAGATTYLNLRGGA